MKKLSLLVCAMITVTIAKGQKLEGDTFTSTVNQVVSVSDTVKIGFGMNTGNYMFIEKTNEKKLKKAGRAADGVAKASSLLGLGGLKTAVTGIKIGQAARNVQTATEAADLVNGNGIIKPEQKLIIRKFFNGSDNQIFADAVNENNVRFTININAALLSKEIVAKDANIFTEDEPDDED